VLFEFDPKKSQRNQVKHGIDFKSAQRLWQKAALEVKARTEGEPRWALIAKMDAKVWTAIFTKRGEIVRIISVRPARNDEKKIYEEKVKEDQD